MKMKKSLSPLLSAVIIIALTISVSYIAGSTIGSLIQRQTSSSQQTSSFSSAILSISLDSLTCKDGNISFIANILGTQTGFTQNELTIFVKLLSEESARIKLTNISLIPGTPTLIQGNLNKSLKGKIKSFYACTENSICYEMNDQNILPYCCRTYSAKAFGGANGEEIHSISLTSDGGYIVAGSTDSFGAGNIDFLITKLDKNENIEWTKTFGGANGEDADSISQTSDNGYIVAGKTQSFGAGGNDFLIIKLNQSGNLEWAKTFGGANWDRPYAISQTSDNGYIVTGYTYSFGSGNSDFLVIKLNSTGNLEWAKTFGGTGNEEPYAISQTSDNGYVVAGGTNSFGAGNNDFLVIKLNSTGGLEWAKTFGGADWDYALSLTLTSDNGYVVAGYTYSFGVANDDFLVIKLNSTGNLEWAKTFGGAGYDYATSISLTSDGGYIVAGSTDSFGAGSADSFFIKLDRNGNLQWAKTFGGTLRDESLSISKTSDGEYIAAGYTGSFAIGVSSALLIKLDQNGNIPKCQYLQSILPTINSPSVNVSDITSSLNYTSPSLSISDVTANISFSSPSLSITNICLGEGCE